MASLPCQELYLIPRQMEGLAIDNAFNPKLAEAEGLREENYTVYLSKSREIMRLLVSNWSTF